MKLPPGFELEEAPASNLKIPAGFELEGGTNGKKDPHPYALAASRIYRPVLEAGGAIGLGTLATAAALPTTGPGAIPLGIAGSALGKAGGSGIADVLDYGFGVKDPSQETSSGAAMRMSGKMAEGAGEQLFGHGISKALKYGVGKPLIWAGRKIVPALPWVNKAASNTPVAASEVLINEAKAGRNLFDKFKGEPADVEEAVHKATGAINTLRDKASSDYAGVAKNLGLAKSSFERAKEFITRKPATSQGLVRDVLKLQRTGADKFNKVATTMTRNGAPLDGQTVKLQKALALRKQIDEKIPFIPRGKIARAKLTEEQSVLHNARVRLNKLIYKQGDKGKAIRAADKEFSNSIGLFDDLAKGMKSNDHAEAFLEKLFKSDNPMYKGYRDKLQLLQKTSGEPIYDDLMKQFAARELNKKIGRPMVSTLAGYKVLEGAVSGTLAWPYLAALAIQSPKVMSRLTVGGMRSADVLSRAAKKVGPGVAQVLGMPFVGSPYEDPANYR